MQTLTPKELGYGYRQLKIGETIRGTDEWLPQSPEPMSWRTWGFVGSCDAYVAEEHRPFRRAIDPGEDWFIVPEVAPVQSGDQWTLNGKDWHRFPEFYLGHESLPVAEVLQSMRMVLAVRRPRNQPAADPEKTGLYMVAKRVDNELCPAPNPEIHATEDLARAEAKRLVEKLHCRFAVLKVIASFRPEEQIVARNETVAVEETL